MKTQALCPKVICIHDGGMLDDFAERGLPFSFAIFVHRLAQPERLGIFTWHLYCSSLALCAKTWLFQGLA
jgi:hypothetical protein